MKMLGQGAFLYMCTPWLGPLGRLDPPRGLVPVLHGLVHKTHTTTKKFPRSD
jgi:hypothetical protein